MTPLRAPSGFAGSSARSPMALLACILAALAFFTTPLVAASADTSTAVKEIEKATNASLLWGPYKPNLYFGIRPRIPKSLAVGLLWAKVEDYTSVQHNFRHTCEQNEGMAGYGWDVFDPRRGGRQTIHDAGNQIDISTEFVKIPGGEHGGSWAVRVKGTPRPDAPADLKTTVISYASLEGLGTVAPKDDNEEELGYPGDVNFLGQTPELGKFVLKVTKGKGEHPAEEHPEYQKKPLDHTFVHSFQVPEQAIWQVKNVLFAHLKQNVEAVVKEYGQDHMPPPEQIYTIINKPGMGSLHLVQKVFEGPFEFDVLYSSASAPNEVTSDVVTEEIDAITRDFSKRYDEILKPQAPFDDEHYEEFSRSLFSNLVGGIGYFYGDEVVDRSNDPAYEEEDEGFWEAAAEARARNEPQLEGPHELFTSIPSRPFFPRGFLWDEGFHLLPIVDWDIDLTLQIIKSWFNLMDEDGWIAREQILGLEARSKVPPEFQVQYPHYANPPTLFFILSAFTEKLKSEVVSTDQETVAGQTGSLYLQNHAAAVQYLKDLYPLLKRHYQWFRRTQQGDIKSYDREAFSSKEGYRWRGRTPRHILTSGLDDYPRAQPPHPGELHVDLLSWMGMMTRSMRDIASFLDEDDDVAEFSKSYEAVVRNVDDLHWSETHQTYCDATVDAYDESTLVCHKGYISLFPFLLGLVQSPDRLAAVLDLLADPDELWSDHGIRSLSKRDPAYGTDENYWRSPVWLNINYLAVARLFDVANNKTNPHRARAATLYNDLRRNLVDTVFESWQETGFAWEQYNDETGKGQRTQHFTGWTSLVAKIAAMPEVKKAQVAHDEL
ncbi:glycoside hydrolase [Phyllosticta capitalensis]